MPGGTESSNQLDTLWLQPEPEYLTCEIWPAIHVKHSQLQNNVFYAYKKKWFKTFNLHAKIYIHSTRRNGLYLISVKTTSCLPEIE